MITTEQAHEYLESVGVDVPEFILAALVDQANTISECLDKNYTPAVAILIQCYLIALMALGQGDRYISSQSAPSGASRSFRYLPFAERWRGLAALLRNLDKHGCAIGLMPPDPTQKAHGGIWIGKGACHAGSR